MTVQTSAPPNRMAGIRRFYFYFVALISFVAGLFAVQALIDVLADTWFAGSARAVVGGAGYVRGAIAQSGGLLLVAAPLFLLHWGYSQRHRHDPDEIASPLRKLFLYVGAAFALGFLLTNLYDLFNVLAQAALGVALRGPAEWLSALLNAAVSAALLAYVSRIARTDGDYGAEPHFAGTVRRLYQAAAGLTGVALLLVASQRILETLLQFASDRLQPAVVTTWWREPLAGGIAMLLVAVLLSRGVWVSWRELIAAHPGEARQPLRRLYLYSAVVISALAVLVPLANVLRELLLMAFNRATPSGAALIDALIGPLAWVPGGLIGWVWHWRYLSAEAARHGESSEGAVVRRLYYYAVAATGLVILWLGAVDLVQVLLDWLFTAGGRTPGDTLWVDPLANGLSMVAVGAPVWLAHWRTVQSIARRPDTAGAAERRSLMRRIYLFGVALVGALLILFYLAQVVYRLLLSLLGDPNAALLSAATANDLARSLIAAALWSLHLLAIRHDSRMAEAEDAAQERLAAAAPPELAPSVPAAALPLPLPALSETPRTREEIMRRIEALEAELALAHSALEQLDEESPGGP